MPFLREWNAHTRAAAVSLALLNGEQMTTAEIAAFVELSHSGAWRLMVNLSIELPIVQIDGKWQRVLREIECESMAS